MSRIRVALFFFPGSYKALFTASYWNTDVVATCYYFVSGRFCWLIYMNKIKHWTQYLYGFATWIWKYIITKNSAKLLLYYNHYICWEKECCRPFLEVNCKVDGSFWVMPSLQAKVIFRILKASCKIFFRNRKKSPLGLIFQPHWGSGVRANLYLNRTAVNIIVIQLDSASVIWYKMVIQIHGRAFYLSQNLRNIYKHSFCWLK